jgi:hypothetical protein
MSATEERTHKWEIVDHDVHQMSGLVAYVVDVWEGDKNDPATSITRHYGVWDGDKLETEDGTAFDPDFWPENAYSYRPRPKPEPLVWESLNEVKKADSGARTFKRDQERMLDTGHSYGEAGKQRLLYSTFMNAIDVIAADPDNAEAWAAVDAWRDYRAMQYEK